MHEGIAHLNKSETFMMFIPGRCRRFAEQSGRKKAAAGWNNIAAGNSRQKPGEPPKLRRTRRRSSYALTMRTGRSAMTRKRENPTLTTALSSGEYEAAVAAFIRDRGVTRCPTACLVRTQASVPAADRAALEHYEAGREQSRRSHIAATARLLGVPLPLSSVC
jgi:hypothetical protein